MVILVDLDDTAESLIEPWVDYLNTKHNLSVKAEDIDEWDLRVAFPTLTQPEIYEPLSEDELWKNVKPKQGAVETLKQLIDEGNTIIVVTASHYSSVDVKMREVLFKYFPFIPWENVIITSRKQMVLGDILIDDAPRNLLEGQYTPILFDAPHNRKFDNKSRNMYRVKDWAQAYYIIKEIEKTKRELGLKI